MNIPISKKIVVLISGRGSNLQALINAQKKRQIQSQIIGVVSNKPDAFGIQRAKKAGILVKVIPSKGVAPEVYHQALLNCVNELNPDLIVLAGYMRILTSQFVEQFSGRMINIHPSLLPCFPGLNAQEQALQAGVKITGCTVHFVDQGCDTGPIIVQKHLPIFPDDTCETLSHRLLKKEHQALVEAVKLIENNKVVLQGNKTLILS